MRKNISILSVVSLFLAVSMMCMACGAKATTMKLAQAEGELVVRNEKTKELEPFADMNLYSGYQMETSLQSYAWINLDNVKLVKMDQNSDIEIHKAGNDLEIFLNSGNLYFDISEPLTDDETMAIRTSTMAVGIRGTCGWMEVLDSAHMQVYILEGQVECIIDQESEEPKTAFISEGETASMSVEGGQAEITVKTFDRSDIPGFVIEEEPPVPEQTYIPWEEAGLEDHVMEWGMKIWSRQCAAVHGLKKVTLCSAMCGSTEISPMHCVI